MSQPKIQPSFNSGEWAPQLFGRVDLEKYRSAAALLRNFFVDYRGGASTRPGTKYCLQAFKSATAVRLIPFQASFTVGYVLEFGDQYIRFFYQGAPVLETGLNITGVTKANPAVVSVVNSYSVGDWVYISNVSGMTELNGHYYKISARSAGTITLADLFGVNINSSAFGTWTSGGTVRRVYTISSPYVAADLALLKFAQNVNEMVICHPSYDPYSLTIVAATNWVLAPITFGTEVSTPTILSATNTAGGGVANYSYIVTAVDNEGQESAPSTAFQLNNTANISANTATITVTWSAVSGASSYNVYKAVFNLFNPVPTGSPHGFIGNVTGTSIADTNITANFSIGPSVVRDPFAAGTYVAGTTITVPGSYTTRPTLTFTASPGITATGTATMTAVSVSISAAGASFAIGDTVTFSGNIILRVDNVTAGAITAVSIINGGAITSALPANPLSQTSTSGSGTGAQMNFNYGVLTINITNPGSGYLATPTITFSAGAAAATATLGPDSAGNPSVPVFFQQRLVLAAPEAAPQTLYMSQPGAYTNFNVSNPIVDSDAITAQLVSGQVNNIKSMVPQSGSLLVLSDGGSWIVNGGSQGAAVTPASIVANAQAFDGASDIPPIVANYDVLFVTSRGSSVRDSTYNFYANVFTGVDISVLASHLFFGYYLTEWAWAQEPYKVVWAVRNDGTILTLTFIKDQEFIGWAHSDTSGGSFKSVCSIVEQVGNLNLNATYTVVERTVNSQTVKYIERFAERDWSTTTDCWCVDSGLQYSGSPATSFTGGEHLSGLTVSGLADGLEITPFVMPYNGSFTLATAASIVTVGIGFTAQLQTMPLDNPNTGEPTVQSKPKKINAVDVRVTETLGLKIGSDFNQLVAIKDLVLGNVNSMLVGQASQVVTDLYTGDTRTYLNPTYTIPGQYCIQQDKPYPATIVAVIPQFETGDTKK